MIQLRFNPFVQEGCSASALRLLAARPSTPTIADRRSSAYPVEKLFGAASKQNSVGTRKSDSINPLNAAWRDVSASAHDQIEGR